MPRWAVDTNVLVRILVLDDVEQAERARTLLEHGEFVVLPTVLVELEWVLRKVFGYDREQVSRAFADLLVLPGAVLGEEAASLRALEWHATGMDFADALHLAGASDCDEFVTFDKDFARRAQSVPDVIPVRLL